MCVPADKCDGNAGVVLMRRQDDYDRALKDVDVLVMPTLPSPPGKLFDDPAAHGPLARLSRNVGLVGNTAPFNSEYPMLGNTSPFNSQSLHPATVARCLLWVDADGCEQVLGIRPSAYRLVLCRRMTMRR